MEYWKQDALFHEGSSEQDTHSEVSSARDETGMNLAEGLIVKTAEINISKFLREEQYVLLANVGYIWVGRLQRRVMALAEHCGVLVKQTVGTDSKLFSLKQGREQENIE